MISQEREKKVPSTIIASSAKMKADVDKFMNYERLRAFLLNVFSIDYNS